MNSLVKITGIALLGSAMAFTSCKKKGCTDPTATNYSIEAKKDDGSCQYANVVTPTNPSTPSAIKAIFLSNRNNDKETFTVNSEIQSQIVASKGTKITIPENAFVNASGTPITGNITLEVLEVHDQSSMIWYGLPTMSNGRILESGGELMVKAYANGQELGLANGVELDIEMPSDNYNPNMTLYYGVETKNQIGDVNWLLADSLGYDDSISYDSILYCDTVYYTYQEYDTLYAPFPPNWQSNYPNLDPNSVWYYIDSANNGNGMDTISVSFATGDTYTSFYLDCNNQTQNPNEGYDFDFGSLGWINCDFLYLPTGNTSGLDVVTPSDFTGANTEIYLHFSTINSVAEMEYSGSNLFETHYNGIPVGMQLTIVAISELNGTYYSSFTPITMTANHSETITMTATTIADIQNAINNL